MNNFHDRKKARAANYFRFEYGFKLRACSACNGSGYYDNHNSPKCSSCDGTGKERYKSDKAIVA